MNSDSIVCLKITLEGMKPAVLRLLEVPLTIRLDRLHLAIQAAMGWTDSHLYAFRIRDVAWGMPDPDWDDGPRDARKARLIDIIQDTGAKTLTYVYDFGDDWMHRIKVGRVSTPVAGVLYPRLIEASGRCPPEDVGGPWGYGDLLDAISDPEHENHAEATEWVEEGFDPNDARADSLASDVAALAKRWARKSGSK